MKTPEEAWAETKGGINLSWLGEQLRPPLTRAAVSAWTKVPAERVLEVARIAGMPREQLRPDLFSTEHPAPWAAL